MCTSDGPRIVPVNYAVVDDDTLVFRTTPYSALGTHADGPGSRSRSTGSTPSSSSGWSVVAAGTGAIPRRPARLRRAAHLPRPGPWAGGQRWLYVTLAWSQLTGRAIGPIGATMTG